MRRKPGRYQLQHQQQQFVIHTTTLVLLKNGSPLAVEPKPLELLALLVLHAGEMVSKREIMDTVWAGRVVSESVIARCTNKLRQALGDTEQTLILNVHGYGYRLTAAVTALPDVPGPTMPPAALALKAGDSLPQRPHWRLLRPLDAQGRVWLGQHDKFEELRAFKFALTPEATDGLKRELTLHRVLHRAIGLREDFLRLYDYNLEVLPYFLELEHCPLGSLADWLPQQAGAVPLAQRIALLAQAADSLAAAHAVGVVHQDVKPENLLVALDAEAQPRLVWADFGSGQVDAATLERWRVTRLDGLRPATSSGGTLLYLAPERLGGQPASVKSDVYSLGVLLYQMVVGDLSRPLAPGWERAIDDPLLRADIATCADTDPQHRLGDAAELARRLCALPERRLAAQQQAEAGAREARLYEELRRSRNRRRLLQAGLAASVLAVAGLAWHDFSLRREQQRTASALATAESLNDFLSEDILAAADPYKEGGGSDVTVAAALERAAAGIDAKFPRQPLVRASILSTVGDAYRALNLYPQAMAAHARGIEAAQAAEGPLSILAAEMEIERSMSLIELDRSAEAITRLKPLIARFASHPERAGQVMHASARHTLGWALLAQDQPKASEAELRAALREIGTPRNERERYIWLDTRWDLAETLLHMGELKEAAGHIEAVYEGFHADARIGRAHLGWVNITRAKLYTEMGLWQKAQSAIDEMDAIAAKLPPDHRVGLLARYARTRWLLAQSQHADAERLLATMLPDFTRILGADHDWTVSSQALQVRSLLGRRNAAAALPLARQLMQATEKDAPDDSNRLRATALLAEAELANGKPQPATLARLREALQSARARPLPEDILLLELLLAEATVLKALGDDDASSRAAAATLSALLQSRGRRAVQLALDEGANESGHPKVP